MAAPPEKVTLDLDARIVEHTREQLGNGEETDAALVERALNAYLLGRALDTVQARFGLSEEEAARIAVEEVHATRRERAGS